MTFVSLTRLRLRSIRFLPFFAIHTQRSINQLRLAPGMQSGSVLMDRHWVFWTMTAWDERESMRRYMTTGAHRTAMPHLMHWCDEASVAHWEQDNATLPSWKEADQRMRTIGRVSKVNHPSPQHADLKYRQPRTTRGVVIA